MLAVLGYDLIEADCGPAALPHAESGICPDLLEADHLMPGIAGTDLVTRACAIARGMHVLVIARYAEVDGIAKDLS